MAQSLEAVFYHGDQERIDYTPSGADVANGEMVHLGSSLFGVCTSPEGIADGVLGSLAITGVFKLKKAVSGGVTFARGVLAAWDTATNLAVAAGTTATFLECGVVIEAAADADDHVKVALNKQAVAQTTA